MAVANYLSRIRTRVRVSIAAAACTCVWPLVVTMPTTYQVPGTTTYQVHTWYLVPTLSCVRLPSEPCRKTPAEHRFSSSRGPVAQCSTVYSYLIQGTGSPWAGRSHPLVGGMLYHWYLYSSLLLFFYDNLWRQTISGATGTLLYLAPKSQPNLHPMT